MNRPKVESRSSKLLKSALAEKEKREGKSSPGSCSLLNSPNVFLKTYTNVNMLAPASGSRRSLPFSSKADKENSPQQDKTQTDWDRSSRSPSPEFVSCGSDDWLSKSAQKLSEASVRTYKSKLSRPKSLQKTPDLSKSKILADRFQKSTPAILRRGSSPVKVNLEDDTLSFTVLADDEESPIKRIKKDPKDIGFENLGNTCYINATMQCLFSLDPVVSDFLLSVEKRPRNKLTDCLFEFIEARNSGNSSSVSSVLRRWHSALGVLDEEFAGYRMQDANELIIQLFDYIKTQYDSYNKNQGQEASVMMTPESSENDSDEEAEAASNNPIRSNFEFKLWEEFFCVDCGGKSDEKEQVSDSLWLPVRRESESHTQDSDETSPRLLSSRRPSSLTLNEAFSEAMKEERESICENCGKKTKHAAESKFSTLPRVLMIQLKRYVYREGNLDKLLNPVEIAPSLDVTRYLSSSTKGPLTWRKGEKNSVLTPKTPPSVRDVNPLEDTCPLITEADFTASNSLGRTYRLVGVIQHIGSSAHSGHYIADTLCPVDRTWRRYDDTDVSQVEQSSVITEEASKNVYILFYVHDDIYQEMERS